MQAIKINEQRLWQSLMDMAEIGATAKGGSNRQALTELDQQGRELFIGWCQELGCHARFDQIGNLFVRKGSRNNDLPPVLIGSHLDTQPTGGKFDGVYGVLAGLEVLRTLSDHNISLDHPVEIAVWTNEEGARFIPAMMGSGVWCGDLDLDTAYATTDKSGTSVKQALEHIGQKGELKAEPFPVKAALEVHIEQGPILEQEQLPIGVLTGVQGIRWYDLIIEGKPCHAGPSPMVGRRDPFQALGPILQACYQLADLYSPWARVTFGDMQVLPGSRNTVPEQLNLSVDFRHPDKEVLAQIDKQFRQLAQLHCQAAELEYQIQDRWHMPVTEFDPDCINAVRQACQQLEYPYKEMVSGAGHDSVNLAKVVPCSMIFVPCKDGLSHNELESAKPEELAAGCNVLLHATIALAGSK